MEKTITVPDLVELRLNAADGGVHTIPYSFEQFVEDRVRDPLFGKSVDTLEARGAIRKAAKNAAPGAEIALRRADWELLKQASRTPSTPYRPEIGEQILPYIYAVSDAK